MYKTQKYILFSSKCASRVALWLLFGWLQKVTLKIFNMFQLNIWQGLFLPDFSDTPNKALSGFWARPFCELVKLKDILSLAIFTFDFSPVFTKILSRYCVKFQIE